MTRVMSESLNSSEYAVGTQSLTVQDRMGGSAPGVRPCEYLTLWE